MLSEGTSLYLQYFWWLRCQRFSAPAQASMGNVGTFKRQSLLPGSALPERRALEGNVEILAPSCFSLYFLVITSYYQDILCLHRQVEIG